MLLDTLQSELVRLQMHPVNLGVSAGVGRLVTLRGSLLNYWKVPAIIDGQWFLGILQALPDAAGPERVMNALCTGQGSGVLESSNCDVIADSTPSPLAPRGRFRAP